MSHSTTFLNPVGNSPKGVGFFPTRRGGINHRLFNKLALKGYTAQMFREKYGIKHPDFSHFLHGRKSKIGKKALRNIRQALIAEGLLNPPKVTPKIPCPTCGRLMRVHALRTSENLEKWLQKVQ